MLEPSGLIGKGFEGWVDILHYLIMCDVCVCMCVCLYPLRVIRAIRSRAAGSLSDLSCSVLWIMAAR